MTEVWECNMCRKAVVKDTAIREGWAMLTCTYPGMTTYKVDWTAHFCQDCSHFIPLAMHMARQEYERAKEVCKEA